MEIQLITLLKEKDILCSFGAFKKIFFFFNIRNNLLDKMTQRGAGDGDPIPGQGHLKSVHRTNREFKL